MEFSINVQDSVVQEIRMEISRNIHGMRGKKTSKWIDNTMEFSMLDLCTVDVFDCEVPVN